MQKPKTLLFFGAGSTAILGLPTTRVQEAFFKALITKEGKIRDRLQEFAQKNIPELANDEDFLSDIETTLNLLYDGDETQTESGAWQKRDEAERKFLSPFRNSQAEKTIEQYLTVYIYPHYDWLAFKAISKALNNQGEQVSFQDILSVMTKSIVENISLPTKEIFAKEKHYRLPTYVNYPERVLGGLRAYKLLLFKLFKHVLRAKLRKNRKFEDIYEQFCRQSIRLFMDIPQRQKELNLENVVSNLCMASTNWDLIFVFLYMKACKEINDEILFKGQRIYLSYGAPMLVRKMKGTDEGWYIFEEDSAAMVNLMNFDKHKCHLAMQIFKFFVPHGLINMRVCPRCQNIFVVLPNDVGNLKLETMLDVFLLDPLPSKRDLDTLKHGNYRYYYTDNFIPSKIDCPICKTPTFFRDTFMQIQSIVKPDGPPLMRKAYIDYCVHFSKANHLVFIGYSFPIDDISHLLYLLTMSVSSQTKSLGKMSKIDRKFSIILDNPNLAGKVWLSIDKALRRLNNKNERDRRNIETIRNIQKLAKKENVRLNFSGFPDILHEFTTEEILIWKRPV